MIVKDSKIDSNILAGIPVAHLEGIVLSDSVLTEKVHDVLAQYREQRERCRTAFERQMSRYEKGDDLLPGAV